MPADPGRPVAADSGGSAAQNGRRGWGPVRRRRVGTRRGGAGMPRRTAVVHNGVPATYAEFASRVRLAASRYRTTGFGGSADLVGALVAHPGWPSGCFAIMRLAAYCPIDAGLPATWVGDRVGARDRPVAHVDRTRPDPPVCRPKFSTASRPHRIAQCRRLFHRITQPTCCAPQVRPGRRNRWWCRAAALTATVRALRRLFALTRTTGCCSSRHSGGTPAWRRSCPR